MTINRTRPPRLAAMLLAWTLPADAREAILGDLEEEFHLHRAGRFWYSRQAMSIACRHLAERVFCLRPAPARVLFENLGGDLRSGWRRLRATPVTCAIAVLTLGLGIGANTALFSVVNAVLLRPLPYPEPERLVAVYDVQPDRGLDRQSPSPGNFLDWRANNRSFAGMTAWYQTSRTLSDGDRPEQVETAEVNGDFFAVAGLRPALGRLFNPEEHPGASFNEASQYVGGDRVVVLSDGFWRRRFGADPMIIGRRITIDGKSWEVFGVLPPGFALPDERVDVYMPWNFLTSYPARRFPDGPPRDFRFLRVVARLRAGVTIEQAGSEMSGLAADLASRFPQVNRGWTVRLAPLGAEMVRDVRPALVVLFAAVGFVLLVACANVAGLLLAKAAGRRHEMAVRASLGASRTRLARLLLAESLLLALAGGIAGILFAYWGRDLLVAMAPSGIPRLDETSIDARVLGFTCLVALATGLVFGIAPALQGSKADLTSALKESGRKGASDASIRPRWRRAFVAAQIALALVLLIGAGLLGRSFARILSVDPGFDPHGLMVMRVFLNTETYKTYQKSTAYYGALLERLRALPGVESAAATTVLPMSDVGIDFVRPYWRAEEGDPGGTAAKAGLRMVTVDYFATMRIPVREGRAFTPADHLQAPRVVCVNEEFARRVWPGESPVGRQLVLDYRGGKYPYEVVGVAGNTKYYGLKSRPEPEIFIPHAQNPYLAMNVVVRAKGEVQALLRAAEREALAVDPTQPVHSLTTMDELMSRWTAPDRFALALFGAFAGLGVLLSSVGIYGVVAQLVAARRREIGIRMALGAERLDVLHLVFGEALRFITAGISAGLVLAFALVRFISSLLYDISAYDPVTFAGVVVALVVAAAAASAIPAGRAACLDPMKALREE